MCNSIRHFILEEAELKINIGALIDNMTKNHVNQSQLAKGAGITNKTISNLINGRSGARIETVNKMAAFLNCAPSDLCRGV